MAAKRTADELTYHRDMLNDLFRVVRAADESQALRLLEIIRNGGSAEEVRGFIDQVLASLSSGGGGGGGGQPGTVGATAAAGVTGEAVTKLEDMRDLINVEGTNPSYRRKVMDIHYLCDSAPQKLPAAPWTTVTGDDDLVSHLVSLYLSWDWPIHAFFDADVFLRRMRAASAGGRSKGDGDELCTPFLVNAVLANACYFSEFSEAYVVPGDIMTKGADFLAEAERLKGEEKGRVCLASLQGTLLLYERYEPS